MFVGRGGSRGRRVGRRSGQQAGVVRRENVAPTPHAGIPEFTTAVVEFQTEVQRGQAGRIGVRLGQAQVLQGVVGVHLTAVLLTVEILTGLRHQDVASVGPANPRDEGDQTDAQAEAEELEQVVLRPSEPRFSDFAFGPGAGLGDGLFETSDFLIRVANLAFQLLERGEPHTEVGVVARGEPRTVHTEIRDGIFDRPGQRAPVPVFLLGEDERRESVFAGDAQVALCRRFDVGLVQGGGRVSGTRGGRELGHGRTIEQERQGHPRAHDSRDFQHGV